MKKSICILMLFLVSSVLSVAAHPVTVKPHFDTDLAVSKTTNDVVVINSVSNDMGYNYEVSEVIVYKNFETSVSYANAETKVLFAENRTVSRKESKNILYSLKQKTKPIYLFVCSIKQLTNRPLIRSV